MKNKKAIILILIYIAIAINLATASISHEMCSLPSGCKILKEIKSLPSYTLNFSLIVMKCDIKSVEYRYDFSVFNQSKSECVLFKQEEQVLWINLNWNKMMIENTVFHKLSQIIRYTRSILVINIDKFKGFNVDSPFKIDNHMECWYTFNFFNSHFNLYNQEGKLVNDCKYFETLNLTSSFVFSNSNNTQFEIDLINCKYENQICELFFTNIQLNIFRISYLIDSFFQKNLIRFQNQSKIKSLNSKIYQYDLYNLYEINLNFEIVNAKLFENVEDFLFIGSIRSIQVDLFNWFKKFKSITLDSFYFTKINRRQGIDWIKNINSDLNVNLSDPSQIVTHKNRIKQILFIETFKTETDKTYQYAYDEDFCLYKDYPFNQLVIFMPLKNRFQGYKYSCTLLRIFRVNEIIDGALNQTVYTKDFQNFVNFSKESSECNFDKRLEECNKTNFHLHRSHSKFSTFDFKLLSEFLLLISSLVVSVFAIVTNSIVVFVINKKENRKEFKQKQYSYLTIYSLSNIFICFIHILSLINECSSPHGLFCSSIRVFAFVQYFKIIFGEYFNSFFCLISNFAYVGFSII